MEKKLIVPCVVDSKILFASPNLTLVIAKAKTPSFIVLTSLQISALLWWILNKDSIIFENTTSFLQDWNFFYIFLLLIAQPIFTLLCCAFVSETYPKLFGIAQTLVLLFVSLLSCPASRVLFSYLFVKEPLNGKISDVLIQTGHYTVRRKISFDEQSLIIIQRLFLFNEENGEDYKGLNVYLQSYDKEIKNAFEQGGETANLLLITLFNTFKNERFVTLSIKSEANGEAKIKNWSEYFWECPANLFCFIKETVIPFAQTKEGVFLVLVLAGGCYFFISTTGLASSLSATKAVVALQKTETAQALEFTTQNLTSLITNNKVATDTAHNVLNQTLVGIQIANTSQVNATSTTWLFIKKSLNGLQEQTRFLSGLTLKNNDAALAAINATGTLTTTVRALNSQQKEVWETVSLIGAAVAEITRVINHAAGNRPPTSDHSEALSISESSRAALISQENALLITKGLLEQQAAELSLARQAIIARGTKPNFELNAGDFFG